MNPEYDMQAFIEEHKDEVFRYWRYKRPGLKYDSDDDESPGPYVSERCERGRLVSDVTLPGYDMLLCFEEDLGHGEMYRTYIRLSEVDIAYSDTDQEDEDEDE